MMRAEAAAHTLSPTSLVHEVFIRLNGERSQPWANTAHYFAAATQAMQRVLIDHARQRGALKRGGGSRKVARDLMQIADQWNHEELVELFDAIDRLETIDVGVAQMVRLRLLAGLDNAAAADLLDLTERTARRRWEAGRKWLAVTLGFVDARPPTRGSNGRGHSTEEHANG